MKKSGLVKCIVRGCEDKRSRRMRLPHPVKDTSRFLRWLYLANFDPGPLNYFEVYSRKRMCVQHFEKDSFVLDTPKLKRNALPSLNLPDPSMFPQMRPLSIRTPEGITLPIGAPDELPGPSVMSTPIRGPSPMREPDGSIEELPGPSGIRTPIRGPSPMREPDGSIEELPGPSGIRTPIRGPSPMREPDGSIEELPGPSGIRTPIRGPSPMREPDGSIEELPGPSGIRTPIRGPSPMRVPVSPVSSWTMMETPRQKGVLRTIGVRKAVDLTPKARHLYNITKRLKRSIHASSKKLKNFRERLRAANETYNFCQGELSKGIPRSLSPFLSCRVRESFRQSKGHRFSLDYKVWALSLLKRSGRAYDFLSKWFVLPSRRTLLRLLSRLSFSTGINDDMFDHLSVTVEKKVADIDRHCILMFDEMSLSPHLDFLEHLDFIEGFEDLGGGDRAPKFADKALVFMVRGLRRRYKQPVAYVFPSGTIKTLDLMKLIPAVISKLLSSGLKVTATVCDQGSTNVAAISHLCAETRASVLRSGGEYRGDYFCVDGVEVIPLFDPPHLLKGIRNGLLTKDLRFRLLGKNKTASWRHVIQLYAVDNKRNRALRNLTDYHVIPDKIKKMKVAYCAQVFSQKVSGCMGLLASINDSGVDPSAMETADLLEFFDTLFDSVNGRSTKPPPDKLLKCAVSCTSGHMEFWAEAIRVLDSMVYIDREKEIKTPSIKNWARTLRNIIALWCRLKTNGFPYLSTRNLNQDPLENKFGCIRSHGFRNVNPTCTNFVGAYKALLLNDMVTAHSVGASCEEDDCVVLDNLRDYLSISRPCSATQSVTTAMDPVSHDTHQDPAEETRCPSEWTASMEFNSRAVEELLKKFGPQQCPECCKKQCIPPHNTPTEVYNHVAQSSVNLINRYLPALCHKVGVGAHLRKMVETNVDISRIACDDHLPSFSAKFSAVVVKEVITSWCTSINRVLSGKSSSNITISNFDTMHRLAYKYRNCKKKH